MRAIPFETGFPGRTRFGRLEWLGTLELSSESPYFGGYSGIAVSADGSEFLAVSDAGSWLRGRIAASPEGVLTGVAGLTAGPLLGPDGKPLDTKSDADAEGIASASPGVLEGNTYISFERRHRIVVVNNGPEGPGPVTRQVVLPPEALQASANAGLEAITVLRGGPERGALVAFAEKQLDQAGNHTGWLLGSSTPRRLSLKRIDEFDVTDAAALPDGGVVLLERCFPCPILTQMRLRRLSAEELVSGRLMEGETLLLAGQVYEIDNMEGIALHLDGQGRGILTVISDDNFNRRFQRTLLMRFLIAG